MAKTSSSRSLVPSPPAPALMPIWLTRAMPLLPPRPAVVNLTTLGSSTEQPEAEMAVDFSPLAQLVSSLYNGRYKLFFQALALVEEQFLTQDRYLHEHKNWFIREMRLRAYQQLLQSYRVVGLDSMANDFGVTVDFLDR